MQKGKIKIGGYRKEGEFPAEEGISGNELKRIPLSSNYLTSWAFDYALLLPALYLHVKK